MLHHFLFTGYSHGEEKETAWEIGCVNIQIRLGHRDSKFRHAGSVGEIRNRNKMPCNDVLMEF